MLALAFLPVAGTVIYAVRSRGKKGARERPKAMAAQIETAILSSRR
jgi:hypothetical protein